MAQTRATMDVAGCGVPNCGHDHSVLFLHPAGCHMTAGLEAAYTKRTGLLVLRCQRCKQVAAEIEVAAGVTPVQ